MTIEDDIAFLEQVPSLRLLGRDALRILAIGSESRYVHKGTALFREGDEADGAFVIQEGSFDLVSRNGGGTVMAGPGTIIGENALLMEGRRPLAAIARESSTVVRITRQLFMKMLEGYPDAAVRMRDALAKRAADTVRDFTRVRSALVGNLTRK